MSLARLWRQQRKVDEARQLLEDSYQWFTEGFDTKDLQEAAVLLRALGSTDATRQRKELETAPPRSVSVSPLDRSSGLQPSAFSLQQSSEILQPPVSNPQRPTPAPASDARHASECLFRKEGEYWTITFADETFRLRDNRGLQYLALLLQRPHEELHALQLTADEAVPGTDALTLTSRRGVDELVASEETPLTGFTDAGELLDPQARMAYRQRLAELETELIEAQEVDDKEQLHALQEERAFLMRELSQAVGLGGRIRKAGSAAERARINVTKAIRNTIKRVSKSHPTLGRYLTRTIKTGIYCAYVPDPHASITWKT
jgi:hypothetical protein